MIFFKIPQTDKTIYQWTTNDLLLKLWECEFPNILRTENQNVDWKTVILSICMLYSGADLNTSSMLKKRR